MHHPRHRQIHAMGAAIVERVRDAMREESAGSGTEQIFFRHPEARQQECLGMASLEDADSVSPEVGLWLKESSHGQGFGKSWPHLLSGDTQLLAKTVSSIRWQYKIPPADASLRIFMARS